MAFRSCPGRLREILAWNNLPAAAATMKICGRLGKIRSTQDQQSIVRARMFLQRHMHINRMGNNHETGKTASIWKHFLRL